MAATFLCRNCKKMRPVVRGVPLTNNTCLRCKLTYNKVILLKCFKAIIDQPDMQEFKSNLEEWYPSEAG